MNVNRAWRHISPDRQRNVQLALSDRKRLPVADGIQTNSDGCRQDRQIRRRNDLPALGNHELKIKRHSLWAVGLADHGKAQLPGVCFVPVARLRWELDAAVFQDCINTIGAAFGVNSMTSQATLRSASGRTVERGSLGAACESATVAGLHHFARVLGLMPMSLVTGAGAACHRCSAPLVARIVVARAMTNLMYNSSSHSKEKTALSNLGIKQKM